MRIAFRMSVHPGAFREYARRHQPIWKELTAVLVAHGVRDYSIFIDEEDGALFGYAEIESRDKWDTIAKTEVCQRWWEYMKDIMPVNEDDSPVSRELREVFHLDRS